MQDPSSAPPQQVAVKVLERHHAIYLVEHPNGDRFYLVMCPYCRKDLSRQSLVEYVDTPAGLMFRILCPLRCPECAGALAQQPKPGIVTAKKIIPAQ